MPDKPNDPFKFWEELKRRRVVRVIPVYAAAAFVILELVDILSDPLRLPGWTLNFVLILLCVGFVISVILSWIYDVTPEGIEKTKSSKEVASVEVQPASRGWKISTYLSAIIIIVFVGFYIIGNIKQSSNLVSLEKSIAVLPFENWRVGEENSHLGNAIANEIATQLAKILEFNVRSFTSSSLYKGSEKPSMPQIGSELDVNFIIEGSVERQDEDVSIIVQVIQAKNDKQIWADKFEAPWKDIIKLRSQIALRIAEELKTILTPEEIEQIERTPTKNLEAYEYYLRGNDYYSRGYEERDWRVALRMYQRAIELDPDFALAYTQIAKSHISISWFRFDTSLEPVNKCKQAIDAAFNLDPNIPEGHIALGLYYYWGFLDYSQALKEFEIALRYLPNNNECIYFMACVYRRQGDWRKSLEMMLKAFSYDPKNYRTAHNVALTYSYLREYSEALRYFDLSINLNPDFREPYWRKSKLFLKWEGNTQNARKTLEEASLIFNLSDNPQLVLCEVKIEIIDGHYDQALTILNTTIFEAFTYHTYYYPKPLLYAKIYDIMGDSEQAGHYYNLSRIVLEDKIREYPDEARYYSSLGVCYAGLGQKDKAIEFGIKSVELIPIRKESLQGVSLLSDLAYIYVMVGEYELALEQLDTVLLNPGFLSAKLLQLNPAWKPLWELPGFTNLIEKYSEK